MLLKPINAHMRVLPGDVLLGLLHLSHAHAPLRSMAIISTMDDTGPSEIMVLSNQTKTNIIFTSEIHSFIDILEEGDQGNRFFLFKTVPDKVALNYMPAMRQESMLESGGYVAFWGLELPPVITKNALPLNLIDRSGETAGSFTAVDVVKEDGMYDLVYRMRKDGRRA